jgi:hypothetical protein
MIFSDFHGHSRKRNVFMYGCCLNPNEVTHNRSNNMIRVIPYLFSQRNKLFSFSDCKFANERDKESTARMVMFKEFNILNSYTIESTFYAPSDRKIVKKKRDVDE